MIFMDTAGVRRIESYFARIGAALGSAKRRASFAVYAMGLFGGAERKSVEPMITARLSIARTIAGWLPRCPVCHRPRHL